MKLRSDNIEIYEFPLLESSRLILRNFTQSDKEDLFKLRSDDEVMRYMDTSKMKNIEEAEKFINQILNSFITKNGISWAITEKQIKLFIGYCGFWKILWPVKKAEIGYAIIPGFWNKGFILEALTTILNYGFEVLQFVEVIANLNPNNLRSINLLEKIGFTKKEFLKENFFYNGKFVDTLVFSLKKNEFHI